MVLRVLLLQDLLDHRLRQVVELALVDEVAVVEQNETHAGGFQSLLHLRVAQTLPNVAQFPHYDAAVVNGDAGLDGFLAELG